MTGLEQQFGNIDIYLFDQILKGRLTPGMRIVDAGCGGGRNLRYLLQQQYEIFAVDADPLAVETTRRLAKDLAPTLPSTNSVWRRWKTCPSRRPSPTWC